MSVKSIVAKPYKKALSALSLDHAINGLRNYLYDFRRFLRNSSTTNPEISTEAMEARVIKFYHMIEKGLALPEPRPGFGRWPLDNLLYLVPALEARRGSCLATRGARGSLAAYVDWHDRTGAQVRDDVRAFVEEPGSDARGVPCGGTRTMTKEDVHAATQIDFERFARSRYSFRNFTGAPVDPADIEAAVATALKTPRVCNRESRRVYAGYDAATREKMLSFQNGNRGFGHLSGAVLIVTSDMRYFTDIGERNQPWIDGGLFAMTLVYALQAKGLGTCMLNWSAEFWRDQEMRKGLALQDHEAVITYIAVGHLPERFEVAISDPPEVSEVLTVLG